MSIIRMVRDNRFVLIIDRGSFFCLRVWLILVDGVSAGLGDGISSGVYRLFFDRGCDSGSGPGWFFGRGLGDSDFICFNIICFNI